MEGIHFIKVYIYVGKIYLINDYYYYYYYYCYYYY